MKTKNIPKIRLNNIYHLNLNLSGYVKLQVDISENICIFLIDSGATISTFKSNKILKNLIYSQADTCTIRGVGAGTISTLGTANSNITLNDIKISHNFKIVPSNFPVPGDGILGLDFLKKLPNRLST